MLGSRLKSLRAEMKITQRDLATATGININTLATYEKETREANYSTLMKFADFFGCTIDYLLGRTEAKTQDIEVRAVVDKYGLEERSLLALANFNQPPDNHIPWLKVINALLGTSQGGAVLQRLAACILGGFKFIQHTDDVDSELPPALLLALKSNNREFVLTEITGMNMLTAISVKDVADAYFFRLRDEIMKLGEQLKEESANKEEVR
ncbi:hypothetical protein FACS1894208_10940 [Clostridia bacterium]|nr:hypothetical protein FACS1894208_10940 [Clostridia bacterium]